MVVTEKMESLNPENKLIYQTKEINQNNRIISDPCRVDTREQRDKMTCSSMYCVPMEPQVRSTKVEKRPLEIKICTPTPNVKIQVIAGDKQVSKVSTLKVCPDSKATADLI